MKKTITLMAIADVFVRTNQLKTKVIMKKVFVTLLSISLLASCNSRVEETNVSNDKVDENIKTIESAELFKDLKGDIAVAAQNLLNQKIKVKNLLVFDSYIDTLGKRCLICVPFNSQNNTIGYLRSADETAGVNGMNCIGFWNPEEETDKALGKTQYFYNDARLEKMYDKVDKDSDFGTPLILENRITMTFMLSDANDFTGLKLPTYTKFTDGDKIKHTAVFTQTIDVVGTVDRLIGVKNNPVVGLIDCTVVDKR